MKIAPLIGLLVGALPLLAVATHPAVQAAQGGPPTNTRLVAVYGSEVGEPDAAYPDAAEFARHFDVTLNEAQAQLELQDRLDGLNLRDLQGESYAGVTIDHERQFQVTLYSTSDPSEPLLSALDESGLRDYVSFTRVALPITRLETLQLEIMSNFAGSVTTWLDQVDNAVHIEYQSDEIGEKLRAQYGSRADLYLTKVEIMDQSTVSGGVALTTCTSGFKVLKIGTGNRGISTAGHCPDSQSFQGQSLNFKEEKYGGSQDIQWHDDPDIDWTNTVADGVSDGTPFFRYITDRKATSDITTGDFLQNRKDDWVRLRHGRQRELLPILRGLNCNFFLLKNDNADMSEDGDSGGPVYGAVAAVGTISGKRIADGHPYPAIVMPQAAMGALDLRVAIS